MINVELLLADASPETIGRSCGFIIICSLLLAGMAKCWQIARRPTTHSLCVYSLLLFLAGLLISGLMSFLAQVEVLPQAGRLALVAVMLNCYITAVATAVIGLVDYGKHAGTYNQGTKQAIATLIAGSLLLVGLGGAFLAGVARGISPEFAARRGSMRLSGTSAVGQLKRTRQLETLNLKFDLPDHPWVEIDAKRINPNATLAVMRGRPQVILMMIGERVGVEHGLSTQSLAELYRAGLTSNLENIQFSAERNESYAGLEGIAVGADAVVGSERLHYAAWVAARNGFAYQLIAFGSQSAAGEVDDALRQMCRRVQQIDSVAVAHSEGFTPAGNQESSGFGYRVSFTGTEWSEWTDADYESSGASFGANCGASAALEVIAIRLPAGRPDTEVLTKAMLDSIKVKYPGPMIVRTEPLQIGELRGLALEARGRAELGGVLNYRAQVLADDERAILIAGWADETDTTGGQVIVDALGRFQFFAPTLAEPSLRKSQQMCAGLILNDMGISSLDSSKPAVAIKYFESAVALRPDDAVIARNLVEALWRAQGVDMALAEVDKRLERFPDSLDLRARQANLLVVKGEAARAREVYTELFASGHDDESDLLSYINLSIEAEAYDEALATVEQFLTRRPSTQVRRWLATVHSRKGDHDRAIAMLTQMRKESPTDVRTAVSLADALEQKGDYSAALEISQHLLDTGVEDEATLMMHGRNQLGLHWYAPAKETFGKVLARNPSSTEAKELFSLATNMLGQGDNSLVAKQIAPVAMPDIIRSSLRGVKESQSAAAANADAEEILRVTGVHFEPAKPLRTTTWRKVKIHTTGGVTRYSTLTMGFDPSAERMFVNRLAVFDEQGKQIAEGSVDDYYVLDDASSGTATQDKVLNVPVPALKPGRTLQFVVTTEELNPDKSFRYQEFLLSSTMPVGLSAVFVEGDVSSLKYGASAPAKVEKAADLIYVLQREPVTYSWESAQPLAEHFLPMVWVGDSRATWPGVAREYLAEIKDKLIPTGETRSLAAELTAASKTPREKVRAIADHVQQSCTYRAIEFGRRARIPNTAAHTVRLKYGDCKDHAVLVHDLLRAVGVTAHLALVSTTGRVRPDVPSIDQFNHMIVYLPDIDGAGNAANGTIIDCTDKDSYPLLAPPPGLADQDILVLDPAAPRLIHTPTYPADAARVVSRRSVTIRADEGSGPVETEIEEQILLNEFAAPAMRAFLKSFGPADRQEAVHDWFAGGSPLRLTSVTVENLEDVEKPLVLKMGYVAPEAFHRVGPAGASRTLVGQLPASWETRYLEAEYIPQRKTPFELLMPMRIESTTKVALPAGYEMHDVDQLVGRGSTRFVVWASRAEAKDRTLTLEYRARRLTGRHAAAEYAAYYDDDVRNALGIFRRPVTLRGPVP